MEEQILEKFLEAEIDKISSFLTSDEGISENRNYNHIGLLSGLPGIIIAVTDTYLLRNDISENVELKIGHLLKKCFEILEQSDQILPTYCDGLAGFGVCLLKLQKSNLIPSIYKSDVQNLLEEINEIVIEHIKIYDQHDNWDLLHGLLGLGLYFYENGDKKSILKVVNIIENRLCRKPENQIYWKKFDKYDTYDTIIDLGNAHGMASVIYFLNKVRGFIDYNNLDILIGQSINFYMDNMQEIRDDINSYFPLKINAKQFIEGNHKPGNSRLGWCYGDLGILYTLLMATDKARQPDQFDKIVSMLKYVSNRTVDEKEFSIDAGFCHGTSGIAMLFQNIYMTTGILTFKHTADYWLNETFKKKDYSNENIINYGFVIENSIEKNISILEGLSGVLAVYLKFKYGKTNFCEEIFMIK